MQNQMKALLRQGKAVYSCTIRTPHPNLAEIAGLAGYECIMLDAEHGTVSSDTLDAMILAVRATGATPIVRVPGVDRTLVKQALDHGADGILFPHISSVEDARAAVSLCKYPPQGKRGAGPGRPIGYGLEDARAYLDQANDQVLVALMLEEPSAVEQLEAIARRPRHRYLQHGSLGSFHGLWTPHRDPPSPGTAGLGQGPGSRQAARHPCRRLA